MILNQKQKKNIKVPNIWVEAISFILLLCITIAIGYLFFNYGNLVEFRELH